MIKKLKQSKKEMIVTKDKIQINSENIGTLNLKEIEKLESTLNAGIIKVKQARNKLIEKKYLCLTCYKNEKRIKFNGCNHICLCEQCEIKLTPKLCPLCRRPYSQTSKLNFKLTLMHFRSSLGILSHESTINSSEPAV